MFSREEEVTQGFQDIMEAYKEEVTFLFYQENSGIRDQVFNYFFSEYRTDVEQKLATFQSKYGQIIDRQDRVLEEVSAFIHCCLCLCVCVCTSPSLFSFLCMSAQYASSLHYLHAALPLPLPPSLPLSPFLPPPPQADGRMGELAQKVQDLEYITDLMEGLAIFFKTEAMTV